MKRKEGIVIAVAAVILVGALIIGFACNLIPYSVEARYSGTVATVAQPSDGMTIHSATIEYEFSSDDGQSGSMYLTFVMDGTTEIANADGDQLDYADIKKGDKIEALVNAVCADPDDPYSIPAALKASTITVENEL